jgi:hypothetical protein
VLAPPWRRVQLSVRNNTDRWKRRAIVKYRQLFARLPKLYFYFTLLRFALLYFNFTAMQEVTDSRFYPRLIKNQITKNCFSWEEFYLLEHNAV